MIDLATAAQLEANPPPPWWPIPPKGIPLADFFPLVGSGIGKANGPEDLDEAEDVPGDELAPDGYAFTDAEIIAATYPGDTLQSVAARLGRSPRFLRHRRDRAPEMAWAMDARRGAA